MSAYYNEFDKYAAQWLRNLIAAGHIAPGDVDERSIEDVRPDDLRGYRQCHFFAGIGVWSYALRRAGWRDDQSIWTGSCPCQPFSAAGQGNGFDDERHLWPTFHHLIEQRRPASLAGEQVASKDADPWLDLVQTDLEALGYAFGAVAFPSAGVGAPHIRDRTYWMANAPQCGRREECPDTGGLAAGSLPGSDVGNLGHPERQGLALGISNAGIFGGTSGTVEGQAAERTSVHAGGLGDADSKRIRASRFGTTIETSRGMQGADREWERIRANQRAGGPGSSCEQPAAGPTNGHWRDADWLFCRDGKFRPVEPGTFPLVNGATSRVGRLRAYGNAINAEQARVFIEVMMECMP
jgi:DNA (cytosine-5)-methyltransferase 1